MIINKSNINLGRIHQTLNLPIIHTSIPATTTLNTDINLCAGIVWSLGLSGSLRLGGVVFWDQFAHVDELVVLSVLEKVFC